ncbi:queD-like protein [Shewanella sp. SNU WT4]|uniref:VC2046/SO_2500 family protein n=1 Tax=Shewanella sp. SNU WT4 TaxID=2590015 RepID=UPI00112DFFC0|nr:VC2046/SO_2500 family protein [Shewanella sp. SNU WT4]QDF66954.1 queD-like protein [Shewanella sp. SNU WT4]
MLIDVNVINELDLGSRLNFAIAAQRRGEFALLLSLLSADIRDMAQFGLKKEQGEAQLRRQFDVSEPQALVVDMTRMTGWDHSQSFFNDSMAGFRLRHSLLPEPLLFAGHWPGDLLDVLNNCSHTVKQRSLNQETESTNVREVPHLCDQLHAQRLMINSSL